MAGDTIEQKPTRVSLIEHAGVSILLLDWTTLNLEQIKEMTAEARVVIHSAPPFSLLILSDFTDTHYDKATADLLSDYAKSNAPFVKASALVGMTGMKKILYNVAARVSGRTFSLHDTRESALKWLVSQ